MYEISALDLSIGLIPVLITLGIFLVWSLSVKTAMVAIVRMLLQLLLIGYALNFIFSARHAGPVIAVLGLMLFAASWISLSSIENRRLNIYTYSLIATTVGGLLTLAVTTQGVLHVSPWYQPSVVIPIAGMAFSSSMNAVSIAAERFYSELAHGEAYLACRNKAYQAAMIPTINSLLAVGLVSLPGMMTGQILSGIAPLIAARYQIMVMLMIFGASGISAAVFLHLMRRETD